MPSRGWDFCKGSFRFISTGWVNRTHSAEQRLQKYKWLWNWPPRVSSSCIRSRSSKASSHCPSFAHARMVVLKLIWSGWSADLYKDSKILTAIHHRPSFSHALIAAVQLMTSAATWTFRPRNNLNQRQPANNGHPYSHRFHSIPGFCNIQHSRDWANFLENFNLPASTCCIVRSSWTASCHCAPLLQELMAELKLTTLQATAFKGIAWKTRLQALGNSIMTVTACNHPAIIYHPCILLSLSCCNDPPDSSMDIRGRGNQQLEFWKWQFVVIRR